MASCYDCGLPYGSKKWADFVVSDELWEKISKGDSLLCVNCMILRAEIMALENCEGKFTSGPFANG